MRTFIATLITILCGSTAVQAAIEIRVSTDPGATFSSETLHLTYSTPPASLNLTVDPSWKLIRIRSTTPATESIPPIVLQGGRDGGDPLRVLVVNPGLFYDSFPESLNNPLEPACLDFGGVTFTPDPTTGHSLRDQTILAVAAYRHTTGPTEVGFVRRFQMLQGSPLDGQILHPITATSPFTSDSIHDPNNREIGVIGYA